MVRPGLLRDCIENRRRVADRLRCLLLARYGYWDRRMPRRVHIAGSAVTVVLSVIVAFRHTGSLSQASGVRLPGWMTGGHGVEFTVGTCRES
jgi:hypothetical protein